MDVERKSFARIQSSIVRNIMCSVYTRLLSVLYCNAGCGSKMNSTSNILYCQCNGMKIIKFHRIFHKISKPTWVDDNRNILNIHVS